MICGIIKVEVSVISLGSADNAYRDLDNLHITKTEFNNCFIIHLFVLQSKYKNLPASVTCFVFICSIFCSDYRFIGTYRVRIR